MGEYVPFFVAHPELRCTSRVYRKNDLVPSAPAKVAKAAKVLRPFPETLATLATLATLNASKQKSEFPSEWARGLARLPTMSPPIDWPLPHWPVLIADVQGFLERWAAQAAALGWPTWELFGCHRRAPWGRIQGMGMVLLLRGDEIAALTATEALVRTATGTHQRYYRKLRDPLHPSERALIWELDS